MEWFVTWEYDDRFIIILTQAVSIKAFLQTEWIFKPIFGHQCSDDKESFKSNICSALGTFCTIFPLPLIDKYSEIYTLFLSSR